MSLIHKLLSCFVLTSFLGHLHHSKWSIAISGSRLLFVERRVTIGRPWRSTKNINILTPRVGFGMLELDSCILNDIELIMCDHEFYILGVIIKSNATSEGKYLPVSSSIFILLHLLWHRPSIYMVSSVEPPQFSHLSQQGSTLIWNFRKEILW